MVFSGSIGIGKNNEWSKATSRTGSGWPARQPPVLAHRALRKVLAERAQLEATWLTSCEVGGGGQGDAGEGPWLNRGRDRSVAHAPLAASPPRRSEAEAFRYSRRRGLRPRCVGQYRLSIFGRRVGPSRSGEVRSCSCHAEWGGWLKGSGWSARQPPVLAHRAPTGERMIGRCDHGFRVSVNDVR